MLPLKRSEIHKVTIKIAAVSGPPTMLLAIEDKKSEVVMLLYIIKELASRMDMNANDETEQRISAPLIERLL